MNNRFSVQIGDFAKRANKKTENVVKALIFEIGKRLIMRSPVGDPSYWTSAAPSGYVGGRFRNNWQYGFGGMGNKNRVEADAGGSQSYTDMNKIFGSQVSGLHYIYNNLPYSVRLEYGHSRQAPQGVVRLTMLEVDNALRVANR